MAWYVVASFVFMAVVFVLLLGVTFAAVLVAVMLREPRRLASLSTGSPVAVPSAEVTQ
jgi:hypothetical protein